MLPMLSVFSDLKYFARKRIILPIKILSEQELGSDFSRSGILLLGLFFFFILPFLILLFFSLLFSLGQTNTKFPYLDSNTRCWHISFIMCFV